MSERRCTSWKGLPSYVLTEAGVTVDGRGAVTVPYCDPFGALYARRRFAPGGSTWWAAGDLWRPGTRQPLIPFGLDRLIDRAYRGYRALAIVEGESDALAAWAAAGAEGLDVLGVPGCSAWRSEWADFARGYAVVYAFGDGDAAGRRLNGAIRRDVPDAVVVDLPPGEDVRSLIQGSGVDALVDVLAKADAVAEFERLLMGEAVAA